MNTSQMMSFGLFFHILNNDKSATSSKFFNYFRNKKALSPETSISLNESDLSSLGWKNPKFEVSKLYSFLVKKTDGTYWLDESKIQSFQNQIRQKNIGLVAIVLIIVILIIVKIVTS